MKAYIVFTIFGLLSLTSVADDAFLSSRCDTTDDGLTKCYFLYDSQEGITWDSAHGRCAQRNQSLVMIPDDDARNGVRDLLESVTLPSYLHVWVSGKRSQDRRWLYMYEKPKEESLIGDFPSERSCGMFKFGLWYPMSSGCTSEVDYFAFCQYKPTDGGCLAGSNDYQFNDDCYHVSTSTFTWFEARNYCRRYTEGADLAVNILHEQQFQQTLSNRVGVIYLWMALIRMPWQWVNSKGGTLPMTSYYFHDHEGTEALRSSCLYLSPTDGATSWFDKDCEDNSRYFICQTESHAVGTPPSDVPHMGSKLPGNTESEYVTNPSETTSGTEAVSAPMSKTTMYIIIGACLCVTLTSVAVVIVLVLRKRKNSTKTHEPNKFATLSTKNITKADIKIVHELPNDIPDISPGYSSVPNINYSTTHVPGLIRDDPYAEIPAEGPSGVKSYNYLADDSASSVDCEDDSLKEEMGTYQNLPDIRSDSSSVELDRTHFLSDSGDVYALPNKNQEDLNDVIVDNPSYVSQGQ